MDKINVGIVTFNPGNKLIGVGIFSDEWCVGWFYHEQLLEKYMKDHYNGLYQTPEYLSQAVLGCTETFWNVFLHNTNENNFILFKKTKEYTRSEFDDEMKSYSLNQDFNKIILKLLN